MWQGKWGRRLSDTQQITALVSCGSKLLSSVCGEKRAGRLVPRAGPDPPLEVWQESHNPKICYRLTCSSFRSFRSVRRWVGAWTGNSSDRGGLRSEHQVVGIHWSLGVHGHVNMLLLLLGRTEWQTAKGLSDTANISGTVLKLENLTLHKISPLAFIYPNGYHRCWIRFQMWVREV